MMKLVVLDLNRNEVLETSLQEKVILGRSSQCSVRLLDDSISRQHCLIEYDQDQLYITDLNSVNGVFIDSERIEASKRVPFEMYNRVQIGTFECKFEDEFVETITPAAKIRESVPKNRPVAQSDPKKKEFNFLGIMIFLVVGGGFLFHSLLTKNEEHEEEVIVSESVREEVKPQDKEINNVLLSSALQENKYVDISSRVECNNVEDICDSLIIEKEVGEGVRVDGERFFVFMNPGKRTTLDKRFLSVRKIDGGDELIAIEKLLTSILFMQFIEKKVSQIQLIILNESNKVSSVYLFDQSVYPKNLSLPQILGDIDQSIADKSPKQFLMNYSRAIPVVKFEK